MALSLPLPVFDCLDLAQFHLGLCTPPAYTQSVFFPPDACSQKALPLSSFPPWGYLCRSGVWLALQVHLPSLFSWTVEGGGNIARASSSWQWPSVCKGLMKKFYFPPMCRVLFGLQWGPFRKDTCMEVARRAGEGLHQGPAQDRQGRLSCVFWKSFIAHLSLLNRAGYHSKALCSSWKIHKYKRTLTNLSLVVSYLSWELIEHRVTGWYGKFCVLHL